jgi:hypothetical protein
VPSIFSEPFLHNFRKYNFLSLQQQIVEVVYILLNLIQRFLDLILPITFTNQLFNKLRIKYGTVLQQYIY